MNARSPVLCSWPGRDESFVTCPAGSRLFSPYYKPALVIIMQHHWNLIRSWRHMLIYSAQRSACQHGPVEANHSPTPERLTSTDCDVRVQQIVNIPTAQMFMEGWSDMKGAKFIKHIELLKRLHFKTLLGFLVLNIKLQSTFFLAVLL